ncbi:MAG: ribosome small subunit-dependent GTPase A [Acidimicrobiales bacterium]
MGDVLSSYGWGDRVAALYAAAGQPGAVPGRVARADRGSCVVVTEAGAVRASVHGTLSRRAGLVGAPATGDWVAVAPEPGAAVVSVLPRWSAISRKDPDDRVTAEQVLAANVDVVVVVSSLDRPVSPNRIERMLAAAWESGASPTVVLTKADLAGDLPEAVAAAEAAAGVVPVLATSSVTGEGLDELRGRAGPGRTLVLLGPSGAGKSTIVNHLLGEDVQATGPVRGGDARGRHTTTSRQLVPLPGGGVLLDTPGLRSLPLWDAEAGVAATFGDVEALAAGCRFGDCRHEGEPGCAVQAAIDGGTLDARRLASWSKLRRELDALAMRHDEQATRAAGRRMGRTIKEVYRLKGPRPR